jgi:hypothetical protein
MRATEVALATFILGFVIEASTGLFQLLSYGSSRPAWIGLYYAGLVATAVGFYFLYRGRHEWTEHHRKRVVRGHQLLWTAALIFAAAFGVIAAVSAFSGAGGPGAPSPVVAGVVGGLVALAMGNFFLGLATLVDRLCGRFGRILAWAGFAWSLGVAVLTGLMVGNQLPSLLHEFLSSPATLIASFAPLAFVMAPLFVAYSLFAVAYADAYLGVRRTKAPPPPIPTQPEALVMD